MWSTYYSWARKKGSYCLDLLKVNWVQVSPASIERVIGDALTFAETLKVVSAPTGRYRYAPSMGQPSLCASVFAALLRHLTRDIDRIPEEDKSEWSDYINSFQRDDGLFCDWITSTENSKIEDWWGRHHLSLLCLMALTALGDKPRHRLAWLDRFK